MPQAQAQAPLRGASCSNWLGSRGSPRVALAVAPSSGDTACHARSGAALTKLILPIFTDFSDFLGRLPPSKTTIQKTLNTLGVEESSYHRKVLHFERSNSSRGRMRAELWRSLLTGFSISDLRDPSPSQILGTSSRFSEDFLGRERALGRIP